MNDKLNQIIYTLNQIEVHGAENLNRLLGCIQALQSLLQKDGDKE